MDAEALDQLPEHVLFRIERGDASGKAFGTPRNPRVPTLAEFNPRFVDVPAGDLLRTIVKRKHGTYPSQKERVSRMTNQELIEYRREDPISASAIDGGWSLTGGHHRTVEISERVGNGQLSADTIVRILLHD